MIVNFPLRLRAVRLSFSGYVQRPELALWSKMTRS
jgi:hypothetical protein